MKWHYQTLQRYKNITFGDIITKNDLSEQISLKIADEHKFFWLFHRNKERFLINAELEEFPIIIKRTRKYAHRNKAYNIVSAFNTLDIKPEKLKTFRAIVEDLCSFKHSNPDHQTLSAIIALCTYIDRINVRVCAEKEFGKDSIYDCLGHLNGDICVFNPESLPAIEYRLGNKVLVLNEIGTMPKEQRQLVLKALLLMGGMNNSYDKAKRGTSHMSKDVYDISELSICLMYNPRSYYKDEECFFDTAFKSPALKSRFFPLFFTGSLDIKQFKSGFDVGAEAKKWKQDLLNITKSLLYYRGNKFGELKPFGGKFDKMKDMYVSEVKGRHQMHLDRILDGVNLFANTEEEFIHFADLLLKAHHAYKVVNQEKSDLVVDEEDVIV